VAGQTKYGVTKGFLGQPDSSKTVDVKVNITPTIAGATTASLNDGLVIWIWDSKDATTVALAASTVGTQQVFSRAISAVEAGTYALFFYYWGARPIITLAVRRRAIPKPPSPSGRST
jgi:hypothetical protein